MMRFPFVITTLLSATPAAAQQAVACSAPGKAFGVTAYQCASCSIKQGGARTQYTFQAEPIVLEASKGSVLQPGDVIEAVNGEPITTQSGADRFASPAAGRSTITVRRGKSHVRLEAFTMGCDAATRPLLIVDGKVVDDLSQLDPKRIESVEVLKGQAAASAYGPRAEQNGVIVITTTQPAPGSSPNGAARPAPGNEPLIIVDGVPLPPRSAEPDVNHLSWGVDRYGFAIGCVPSCTRAKTADGTEYYRFDGYPPVVTVVPGGPAEQAGVRTGDVVSAIDGKSMLTEDGALRFFRANKSDRLYLTVIRGGHPVAYLLNAR